MKIYHLNYILDDYMMNSYTTTSLVVIVVVSWLRTTFVAYTFGVLVVYVVRKISKTRKHVGFFYTKQKK